MFGRVTSPALAAAEVEALLGGGHGTPYPLNPYVVAKLAEDPELEFVAPELATQLRRHRKEGWTSARVALMSTEVIQSQLRTFGVPFDPGAFAERALDRGSAWDIATAWIEEHPVVCRRRDQVFLGLAAVELWKRLAGDRLSEEALDDEMQKGYALLRQGRDEEGAEAWWTFWQRARTRIPGDVRQLEDAGLVAGMQFESNWTSDFRELLEDLVRWGLFDPGRAVAFILGLRELFPAQDESAQVSWNGDLARFLFASGRQDEAVRTLEEGLLRWPRDPWVYVAVADEYSHLFRGREAMVEKDLDRARSVLHAGLAAVDPDARGCDVLLDRLQELDQR